MIKHHYYDDRTIYKSFRVDFCETSIMCYCGKRLMDKNITEIRNITFNIDTNNEHCIMVWYCKIMGGHTAATTYYCCMLRFLNRFIRIAKIVTTVYVDSHKTGYEEYHVVPDKVDNIVAPIVMNIL